MTDGRDSRRATRRSVLALGAGVASALAGCSAFDSDAGPGPTTAPPDDGGATTTTSGPPTRTRTRTPDLESEFARVVDAVDDLGCDPSGQSPCDAAVEGGVDGDGNDDVAIRFPAGTYRFDRGHRFEGFDRLGFVGVGDVSFVPPAGFNDKLLSFVGRWARFSGIDIDVSAADTTAGLRFITRSGFLVEGVEFLGRGLHPDASVVNALALAVQDAAAEGTVRDVVARRGSAIGHYKRGNGRVGMWIGGRHRGHVTVEDCRLEEFGNNGIYGSRCEGTVAVVGGLYRNNNVSGVRLGGGGSVVRGATLGVDLGAYTGPYTATNTDYDTRAIVVEQGPYDLSGRVRIEDCDVRMVNADRSQGAIVVWPSGNGPRIERCTITNDVDWVSGVQGMPPDQSVATGERGVELVDTTLDGSASWGSAVELVGRPGSTLQGTTVDQRGETRDGLRLVDSAPCTLASASITTSRFPVFAYNPGGATGGCLVSISGETRLERTGPALESLRMTDVGGGGGDSANQAADAPSEGADRRCIGEAGLSETASTGGVGIAGVEETTVTWQYLASMEAWWDG